MSRAKDPEAVSTFARSKGSKRLLRSVARWRGELPGRLLVGVSGGADSVALLHALVELGYRPHVCHLNHQWRGAASNADATFVCQLAAQLRLPATIKARKVRHAEDAARNARHDFFRDCAKATGIRTLVLAHTAGDQAETVLLRLIRGAGPSGLAGMAAERAFGRLRVVRPLLGVTRPEVLDYLHARGLEWREDASNRDERFLRNRVRHVLLPLLEREFNPAICRVLCRTAEILRAETGQEPVAQQRRAIRQALGNISFGRVEEVRKQLPAEWPVKVPGRTTIRELGLVLQCTPVSKRPGRRARSNTEQFDAAALGERLIIRTWRPGDRFQPLGMQHKKKLQDFFVDEKVPRHQRPRVPLLCTATGRIAWVIGHRIAEPFKLTGQTQHLLRCRALFR